MPYAALPGILELVDDYGAHVEADPGMGSHAYVFAAGALGEKDQALVRIAVTGEVDDMIEVGLTVADTYGSPSCSSRMGDFGAYTGEVVALLWRRPDGKVGLVIGAGGAYYGCGYATMASLSDADWDDGFTVEALVDLYAGVGGDHWADWRMTVAVLKGT